MFRLSIFIFLIIGVSSCKDDGVSSAIEQVKPNIVWLVSEDNSKHFLKLYQADGVAMPNLEKLAAQGLVFNHAFSNAPVCSVARSTIISGCYAPRIGAQYHRRIEKVPLPGALQMFPHYLRSAGYYTTNNAKEDYNIISGESVWNESSKKASYRNRPAGSPFFHVQNFGVTHEGQLHFTEEQMQTEKTITDPSSIQLFPIHPPTPTFKYTYAKLHDHHLKLDEQLGEFVAQLESDGLMENTFIFYYGDHGGVLPGSKGYAYETGLHVPMLVYVPPQFRHLVPAKIGSRINGFVRFVDLGPTVLHLAGIDVPKEVDGKPFLGSGITLEELESRNKAFGYADRFDEKYDLVRTWRKGNFKYIRNYQPFNIDGLHNFYRYRMLAYQEWRNLSAAGQLNASQQLFFNPKSPEALYNLANDPYETKNLHDDPAHTSVLKEMREALQKHVKSMPDLSFFPEPYFLEKGIKNPTGFGEERKAEISDLVDIADLSLLPISDAKDQIGKALISVNPWHRYWALITCSSFGRESSMFIRMAENIAESDKENIVRMRALEFLCLLGRDVPSTDFLEVLGSAASMIETNLMLNSVALLKEVIPEFNLTGLRTAISNKWIDEANSLVPHRVEYIETE